MFNFINEPQITSLTIPKNVTLSTTDFSNAFRNQQNLQSARLDAPIVNLFNAFRDDRNLKSVQLNSNTITNIRYAFYNCVNLSGTAPMTDSVIDMVGAFKISPGSSGTFTADSWRNSGSRLVRPNSSNQRTWYYNITQRRNVTYTATDEGDGGSLEKATCGNNVIDMHTAYQGQILLEEAACGNNVQDMSNAYGSCQVIINSKLANERYQEKYYSNSTIRRTTNSKYYEINLSLACRNLKTAACGPNVINMSGTYENCYNLLYAVCGPNVIDMSNSYRGCYNLKTAVCGPNVTTMSHAYTSCHNLSAAVCGNNVTNMCHAYYYCQNLTTAVCGLNVIDMSYAYYNCRNLLTAVCGDNVKNMSYAYAYCYNLKTAVCGPNVTNMRNAYAYCCNLKAAVCGDNVRNMSYTYFDCRNVQYAVCGNNVTNMGHTYYNCVNLKTAACGENVIDMSYAYYNCRNLKTAVCGPNVTDMNYTYSGCRNLRIAICGDNVTGMISTYYNCGNVQYAACGNNVTSMFQTYSNCVTLKTAACGENVTAMDHTYNNCQKLLTAVCGPNVTEMNYTYQNCVNLKTAVCGPNVAYMTSTYENCHNLSTAVIGANVIDASDAYQNCYLAVNTVTNQNVYTYTENAIGINVLSGGANLTSLWNTYRNCRRATSISGSVAKVTDFDSAFQDCAALQITSTENTAAKTVTVKYNYVGGASNVQGLNMASAEYLYNTFRNCRYLTAAPAAVPAGVTNMYQTYANCASCNYYIIYYYDNAGDTQWNYKAEHTRITNMRGITSAKVGANVEDLDHAYEGCFAITGKAVCGANVISMNYAYANAGIMNWTNYYYHNGALVNDPLPNKVASGFRGVNAAVCGNNVQYMCHAFDNCVNLRGNAVVGPAVQDMDYAYANTWWLNGATTTRPAEVLHMNGAYSNSKHLYNIVNAVGDGVMYAAYAFNNSLNIKGNLNIYAESIRNFHMFFGGILGNNRLNVRFVDGSTSLKNFLNANLVTPTSKLTWTLNGTTYENATYNIYVYPTLTV